MKPTPQTSPTEQAQGSFPLTDYSFQTTMEAPASAVSVRPETQATGFHKLSTEFFGLETHLENIVEGSFFILLTGVAVWPLMSMLACLAWMKIVA
jgi:hypothetical protein